MSKITITTKSPEQIAAAFATVYGEFKVREAARNPTQADRLAPYRAEIVKLRRRGLSWTQVAQIMADPRIGEKVSAKLLANIFGETSATPASKPAAVPTRGPVAAPAPASVAAPLPAPAPARPRHLIIDPLTGRRLPDPIP